MSIETGRKIVDYILDLYEKNESDFVNQNTQAVVLDFIGGEPLLEAKLIERICDYWFSECFVSLYLDYAELQAERKIPMSMEDWAKRLDGFWSLTETNC